MRGGWTRAGPSFSKCLCVLCYGEAGSGNYSYRFHEISVLSLDSSVEVLSPWFKRFGGRVTTELCSHDMKIL